MAPWPATHATGVVTVPPLEDFRLKAAGTAALNVAVTLSARYEVTTPFEVK